MFVVNFFEFSNIGKMEEGVGSSMDPKVGFWNMLWMMQSTPTLFKMLANLNSLKEFKELTSLVIPIIISDAISTSEAHIIIEHPSKFNPT